MTNELEAFTQAHTKLHYVREGFTLHKNNWYAWNYWAQHQQNQFSFSAWMAENKLNFEDIAGSKQNYAHVKIRRDREEGYRYYSAWRGAQSAKDEAEKTFDQLFEVLWFKETPEGKPKYSKEELAKAIGRIDGEDLRKFAAKKKWYKPRKRKGTTK